MPADTGAAWRDRLLAWRGASSTQCAALRAATGELEGTAGFVEQATTALADRFAALAAQGRSAAAATPGAAASPDDEVDARFGNVAIPQLIRRLEGLGCSSLVAKVFGGAAVMPTKSIACVGNGNTDLAMALLRERRIPVIAQRTGGIWGS